MAPCLISGRGRVIEPYSSQPSQSNEKTGCFMLWAHLKAVSGDVSVFHDYTFTTRQR